MWLLVVLLILLLFIMVVLLLPKLILLLPLDVGVLAIILLLLLTVVGIRGDGKTFDCGMMDEIALGVRTASSSPEIILLSSGVDRFSIGVTKLGAGWLPPPLMSLGFVKSKDKSRFVFSMLLFWHGLVCAFDWF